MSDHKLSVEYSPARTTGPGSDVRALEHAVLNRWYGDTPELLEETYGPYEDQTVFFGVRSGDGGLAGFARLILPGRGNLKTIDDLAHDPWRVDGAASAREAGIDLARAWDIATIGVDRRVLDSPAVAMTLYRAIWQALLANDGTWVIGILDQNVRALLDSAGIVFRTLPGTWPASYMGSPACAPIWLNVRLLADEQRQNAPEAYRMIGLGEGLDEVVLPDTAVFRAIQS